MRTLRTHPLRTSSLVAALAAVLVVLGAGAASAHVTIPDPAPSVGPLPADEAELAFPAIQTYGDGQVVSWIDVTPASGADPDHPQPVLHLVDATTSDHAATATTAPDADSDDGNGLAVAALV